MSKNQLEIPWKALVLAWVGAIAGCSGSLDSVSISTSKFKSWTSHEFVRDPVMNDQFRWVLSQMLFGQADLGECMEVAGRVVSGDEESWLKEWTGMAERLERLAGERLKAGKRRSAVDAYYRSATYYRASMLHFSNPYDPRVLENTRRAVRAFEEANRMSSAPVERVEIPYEGTTLPAYLYRAPLPPGKRAPLLIVHQGRDAWPEDSRWVYQTAIQRGIHCLMVHAPGQGLALRQRRLPFRPDWEKVITPIVDYAVRLKGVDPSRLGLMGLSFGGALVPRAVAFEKRFKVAVADPGVLNWSESIFDHFRSVPGLLSLYRDHPRTFDALVGAVGKLWGTMSWFFRDAELKHGVDTPSALFDELAKYDNTQLVSRITTPMLVMDGVEETASPGQAKKLYDALRGPKEMMLFDGSTSAQLHCQNGGLAYAASRLFDWLEDHL